MNVTRKDIDQLNAILTIQVEKADYAEKVEKSLRAYRKKANIPGFRPGMVPMGMVKKLYGKAVLGEEINKVLSDALFTYIRDNNLNVLGEPLPNETEQKDIDFDTQEDFEFLFDIALAPEVATKLTEKDKVPYYEISVDDKMINDQVDMFTRRFGQYIQAESVEENDVLKGKMIEMENGAVKENGIVVEDATLSPLHMKEDAQKQLFLNANKEADVVFNPQTAFAGSEVEIASLLKLKKEEVKELNSDFTFHIEGITRYQAAEVNQELFDKVYGEGAVADEAAFRAKVAEGIANDLKQEGAYRFGIDAKALLMKKNQKVAFPEEFLKRWLLATNEKMTQETLDKDFPAMLDELKWQLIKDKLAADNKIEVKEEDVQEYAKYVAKMQFAQYGITGVEDAILENYAKEMMNNKDQVRGMLERVLENKVFELVKGLVKLENKTISMEQLQELYK
jgi:trigger factor